jgi:hypothetical protein
MLFLFHYTDMYKMQLALHNECAVIERQALRTDLFLLKVCTFSVLKLFGISCDTHLQLTKYEKL